MRHRAKFREDGGTVLEIWPNFDFQDGGRPPSRIFESWKFFTSGPIYRTNLRHCAKFGGDDQTVQEIYPIFDFQDGGRPPSWICFTRVATTHEEYLVVFVYCAKFGCNRRSNINSMQILLFCTLSLKMPIHAPKIVFWILPPKWGAV